MMMVAAIKNLFNSKGMQFPNYRFVAVAEKLIVINLSDYQL